MKNKYIVKIILALLIGFFSIGGAFAVAGLNIVLSNQNPDPVSPGNFVELNVKVSNTGSSDIRDAKVVFVENDNFKIAEGKSNILEVGILPSFSALSERGSVTAKFLVEVSENTPFGLNPVEIMVDSSNGLFTKEISINVRDKSPILNINNVVSNEVEAGDINQLSFEIENINGVALRNFIISLKLNEVTDQILTINSDTSQKVISSIRAGESKKLEFEVLVSPEAVSDSYLLPVEITFEDSLGNSHLSSFFLSVLVYSKPDLSLKIDSQDSFELGMNRISFAISNPGTSSVKGTEIEILDSQTYEVLDGGYTYIGDLNPDDFQTNQLQIYLKEEGPIMAKLSYSDSFNNKEERIVEMPVKTFNSEELERYGLSVNGSIFSGFTGILIVLVVLVAVVFFYNRRKKKK
jgi:hypothetical protein